MVRAHHVGAVRLSYVCATSSPTALFHTVIGSVLLGVGINGIMVGVPRAQREYDEAYARWAAQCKGPYQACTWSCEPTNCAPCVECASGTGIAFGSVMLVAGIAIFIALLSAHIRKVDMFASV